MRKTTLAYGGSAPGCFHLFLRSLKQPCFIKGIVRRRPLPGRTLNENSDFRRVYYRGKSQCGSVLICYVLKNRLGIHRVGITASKKIGNAVKRNRARRVIREAFRQLEPLLVSKQGYDIVFVARTRTAQMNMNKILEVMRMQLKKAGLLEENRSGRGL